MTLERTIAQIFRMDDATWMRHANPWSGILRLTALPAFIVAFWSRLWLGWWAVIPVIIVILWTWYNPRIFAAPQSLDHWMSKGAMGERVWLNRDAVPVPDTTGGPQCSFSSFRYLGALYYLGCSRV